jgi:hypothetical protein
MQLIGDEDEPRHPDPWLNRSRKDRAAWIQTMPHADDDLMDVVEF